MVIGFFITHDSYPLIMYFSSIVNLIVIRTRQSIGIQQTLPLNCSLKWFWLCETIVYEIFFIVCKSFVVFTASYVGLLRIKLTLNILTWVADYYFSSSRFSLPIRLYLWIPNQIYTIVVLKNYFFSLKLILVPRGYTWSLILTH